VCFDTDSRPPIAPIAGGSVDGTTMTLTSADGTPLDADRICLATAGHSGIIATADTIYPTLLNGLDQIAKRKDIEISAITLTATDHIAKATFPLCLRLRR